jgi:peptidoglycan hydrolase-like protein with peptidoglycan-binding domain
MQFAARRLVPVVFAVLMLVATAPTAAAFTATYPIESIGNRGADVRAIQGLLVARGIPTAIDGIFGTTTEDGVKTFQTSRGLTANGIVGAATWSKLIVALASGSTGEAVKVLQRQLNEKRFARIPVSGFFGAATRAAVITFQKHIGMTPHGKVGPVTWQRLLWHYDSPAFTATSLCDYTEGNRNANWATGASIGQLEAAVKEFFLLGHGRVAVGDASFEHGGNIPGHATHEVGMDVDLRLIRKAENQCSLGTNYHLASYDRAATRELILAIRAAAPGRVKLIYFNDPVMIAEGLTTKYFGHDDHLHVRYCEPGYPLAMYRC